MLNNLSLQELIKLSETNSNQIKIELAKVDKVFDEVAKNIPDDEISKIEKIKSLSKKAMNLAKEGKTAQANEVIEEIKKIR